MAFSPMSGSTQAADAPRDVLHGLPPALHDDRLAEARGHLVYGVQQARKRLK